MEAVKRRAGSGKSGIIVIIAAAAAVLALYFVLSEKKEPIKIGAIISLSGPFGHLVDVRDGILLAADEVNTWGGINGRKVKLIIGDSKSEPEEAIKAFKKIESVHHPLLYVSTNSSVSMALAPFAKENRVPLVGLVVSTNELTKQNEWVFKYYTSAESEAEPILYILKRLKVKKLGILYQNDEYGASVFKQLREGFEKTGGTIISEPFELKNLDFKTIIGKLKDAEAIYTVGFPRVMVQAIKRLREENYTGFLLGTPEIGTPEVY